MIDGGVTIIIQGPLETLSVGQIENTYLKYGPVVVSTWTDYTRSRTSQTQKRNYTEAYNTIQQLKAKYHDKIKFISKPFPEEVMKNHPNNHLRSSTFYFYIQGMVNALQNVETKYAIRTRSVERFYDLDLFVDKLRKYPNKMIMGNMFVRPMCDAQFHIGDHIFASKTKTMFDAYDDLLQAYDQKKEGTWYSDQFNKGGKLSSPEQVYALAWLKSSGVDIEQLKEPGADLEHRANIYKDYFYTLDLNKIGIFDLKWQAHSRSFQNHFENPHRVYNDEDVLENFLVGKIK